MVCLGGSHAQREVIKDTLLVALMRSGQTARAQAVLDERLHRRPSLRDALAGEHRALSRGVSRRGWRVSPLRTVPHLRLELLDPLAKNREELPRQPRKACLTIVSALSFPNSGRSARGPDTRDLCPDAGLIQQRYLGRDQVVPEYVHRVSVGQKFEAASWNHPKRRVAARGKRVTVPALSAALSHARKLLTSGQPAVPSGQIR